MQNEAEKQRGNVAWGFAASVLLHGLLLAIFLLNWPLPSLDTPPEEVVSVEMVPEPQPEPQPEPEAEPQPSAPEPPPEPPPSPLSILPAIRPAVSDAPESETALGQTPPDMPDAPSETAPKAEPEPQETDEADAPEAPVEEAPPEEEAPAPAAESPPDMASEMPEIAASDSGEEEGTQIVVERPPVPVSRPQPPTAAPLKPARRLLSAERPVDPARREAFGQLPLPKRITQLCAVEALAQIVSTRRNSMPHGMVPFGKEGGRIVDGTMEASGGAYRTMAGDWYDIAFRCSVDIDRMKVTAFSYRLGERKLSREERTARGLVLE